MSNMPILGSQTLPYGNLPSPLNVNLMENVEISIPSSSGPPNTIRIENSRPIFPNMLRTLPLGNPSIESLAIFYQQLEESHHDLVNILTQQMATILLALKDC